MKVAIVAARPKLADKKANIKIMKNYIKKKSADLYIFGELFLSGYRCKDELRDLAEGMDGIAISEMKEVSRKENAYIIFGMPFKDKGLKGLIKNAAILIHPDGRVDVYEKWFLPTFGPFEEKIFFDEGEDLKVFDTMFGKIGLLICYDLYFAEIPKAYALQGADLIVCISASPSTTREYFESLLPARAIENTVFFAYSNLVGAQEDLVFWGGSQILSPLGKRIARIEPFKEGIVLADIDLDELERARAVRPVLRDLRPEIYQDLYELSRRKS
jgi:predicted amidohydrolase